MQQMINVADMVSPSTGLTYRQENNTLQHKIPLGAIVEITYRDEDEEQNEEGMRLRVAMHNRDCDGTPVYSLTSMTLYNQRLKKEVFGENSLDYRQHFSHGFSEGSLKVVRLPDGTYPLPPKTQGYLIHGSTGCSCCRENNFVSGIYETLESAMEAAEDYVKVRRVASQYSNTGIYTIREIEYEQLSDGRVILGKMVFDDKHSLYEYGSIAETLSSEGKSLGHLGSYLKG